MKTLSIAIAQLNPTVGDIAGNAAKILAAYEQGVKNGAEIIICPELSLIGYPPEDLVLSPDFQKQVMTAAKEIAAKTKDAALVFGTLWEENGAVYNAAVFAAGGRILQLQYKTMLPNYGVFDEKRIFSAGGGGKVFEYSGKRIAMLICEDIWYPDLAKGFAKQTPDLVIAINASPFERGKLATRKSVAAKFAQAARAPLVYVNMVGGQDDIVFDGASFMVDAKGYVTFEAPGFVECVIPALRGDLEHHIQPEIPAFPLRQGFGGQVAGMTDNWQAMKLGLADYVRKNGFKGVLLGLSGGIDSAVSAVCAVDALGAERVHGVLLPSPYTAQESINDALSLAKNLGIHTDMIAITPAMETYQSMLAPVFDTIPFKAPAKELVMVDWMEDVAVGGNIQARIRGQILMAISNRTGFMLLSTGNKSEIAVGYTTLYGDSCGGYNVLKDVYKTEVYQLAKWRNSLDSLPLEGGGKGGGVIPENSITRAPSAELKPDQKDQDQLPPYDVLDAILQHHIEERKSAGEIIGAGFEKATVEKVLNMVRLSEYKRRQSCPGVKLTPMMFGRDRRYPLTNKF